MLTSVYFTDINTGYVAGGGGLIKKTVNGGTTWTPLATGITRNLTAVHFPTASIGYAVGTWGAILKTTDGGITWSVLDGGTTAILKSVYFLNSDTGYVVGYFDTILKTTDGGVTWAASSSGTGSALSSVYFTDANTGYIAGSSIIKTNDGGITWNSIAYKPCGTIYFPDSNHGYAAGNFGLIYKTSNAGATWTDIPVITNNYFNSVFFTDSITGYVVGTDGTILKTTNGGGFVNVNELPAVQPTICIYPNPTFDRIIITSDRNLPEKTLIDIYNTKGEHVIHKTLQYQNKIELDVSTLSKGLFLVKILSKQGIEVKKIIIL
jgi:photosystem II stability/assembly factor-like uncharacterized protein